VLHQELLEEQDLNGLMEHIMLEEVEEVELVDQEDQEELVVEETEDQVVQEDNQEQLTEVLVEAVEEVLNLEDLGDLVL
jgi:hypothetical protein